MEAKVIGEKIAKARKGMGLSQAQLGERLFISPQAVGKWERGESVPDIMMMGRLAKVLNVDLNHFAEGGERSEPELVAAAPATERSEGAPTVTAKKKLGWDMSSGNWVDADFSGLKELHESFSNSNMQRCKFRGSHMAGLLLNGNNIDSCDFSGSVLDGSRFRRSNVDKSLFNACTFQAAEFEGCNIGGCDFTQADFTGAVFRSSNFEKNNIDGATLDRTAFIGTNLDGIVFGGTLRDCSFDNCGFQRVTFRNATLVNTLFKGRRLKRVEFIDCRADRMTYEFLKSMKAELDGLVVM